MELADLVTRRYHWPTGRTAAGGIRPMFTLIFPLRVLGRYLRGLLTLTTLPLVHRQQGQPAGATTASMNLNLVVAVTWLSRHVSISQAQGGAIRQSGTINDRTRANASSPTGDPGRTGNDRHNRLSGGRSGGAAGRVMMTGATGDGGLAELPFHGQLRFERSLISPQQPPPAPLSVFVSAPSLAGNVPAMKGDRPTLPATDQVPAVVARPPDTGGPESPPRLNVARIPGEPGWPVGWRDLTTSAVLKRWQRGARSGAAPGTQADTIPRMSMAWDAGRQERVLKSEQDNFAVTGLTPTGRLVRPPALLPPLGPALLVPHLGGWPELTPPAANIGLATAPTGSTKTVTVERKSGAVHDNGREGALPAVDLDRLTDEVYRRLEQRLISERERRSR